MVTVTPDQRLLLRAALDEPELALRCFAQWLNHVDIKHTGATEYRLLPLVYNNIGRMIPDKVAAARVKGVAKHVWLSNHNYAALGAYALDRLILANVPTVILKGSAMMVAVSAENMRSMDDCDILVPAERAPQALAALAEVGLHIWYDCDVGHFTSYDFKALQGISLRRLGEQTDHLDIHWRPLEDVGADELTREFFDQSVPCILSGRTTRRPCFEHMLLHSAVHGTRWDTVPRYDWLADAVLILRKARSKFDWSRFADTAKRYGLVAIIHAAMSELRQTFDIAIPIQAFGRLSRCHVIDGAEAHWRSMDPASVPRLGGYVMALQKLRRENIQLANKPLRAILYGIRRYLFDPVPRALMRPTTGPNDDDHVIFLSGWTYKEKNGRWTEGPLAVLAIHRPPGRRGSFLRLQGHMIQGESNQPQVIDVCIGWRRVAQLSSKAAGVHLAHVIPLPTALSECQVLAVLLHIRRPIAPAAIGLNPDQRQLGMYLTDIRITPWICDAAATPLHFHENSDDLAVLWSGWSHPDAEGCWTDGSDASLRWISPRDLPSGARLVIRGFAFSPDEVALKGAISINGRQVGTLGQLDLTSQSSELSAPLDMQPGEREINVHIHIDNPRSPRQAGLSSDERKLGLFVQSVCITLPWICDAAATLRNRALRARLQESEADRAARLEKINILTDALRELEADRAARLDQIKILTNALKESEADRAARLKVIGRLNDRLNESEADRAARLQLIERLTSRLNESEADRAARLEQINILTNTLKESEADRAARLEQINILTDLLKKERGV
jgi:hypothetical protein